MMKTPLIGQADDDTWEVPSEIPSWASSEVPAGIDQEQLASTEQTEALVDRWRRERGEVRANLEFASSTKGELWLRWGDKWLLLTNKKKPGEFLAPSTLKKYGTSVTGVLGVRMRTGLSSRQAVDALHAASEGLERAAANVDTVELQDLGGVATSVSDTANDVETAFAGAILDLGDDEEFTPPMREITGLDKALRTIRGELTNNLAKLSELDRHIALEKRKLSETADENLKSSIAERLKELQDERSARLEAASVNREALRTQISRMRETIRRILNEDKTLPERIRTLFREQGVTIASILTAIGLAISTLVLSITGGGAAVTPSPPTPPADKGGLKEWLKKHLQSLKSALEKLAGKAAAALPGIIGSLVSWLLSMLAETAGWLAENLWALVLTAGSLLIAAVREWSTK